MGITVGLQPNPLSATAKRQMKQWLQAQLAAEELASNATMPVANLAIYVNGEIRRIQSSYWNANDLLPFSATGDDRLHVGHYRAANINPSKPERLAVLGGIIGLVGLWDELTADFSKAVGRVILEAYNSCFHGMINAPQPAVKLAFSADKQMAAVQYAGDDDQFYRNNGEPVKVDETWQVVAA